MKILGKNIWHVVVYVICFMLLGQVEAQAQCACDTTPPDVIITENPVNTLTHEINLSGDVSDEVGVVGMKWQIENDLGVVKEGTPIARTSWETDPPSLSWDAQGIGLSNGINYITVIAWDAAGNEGRTDELVVDYELPDPSATTIIPNDKLKTKITLFPRYDKYDFVTVVGYIPKAPAEVFPLPFDQDLTVSVWVNNPDLNAKPEEKELLLFEEKIPAYTVRTGSSKYRYTGPSLRDMQFVPNNATSTYMYLYAARGNYLANLKALMTTQEFIEFVAGIKTYKVVIQIGNRTWLGVGNPTYADVSPNSHVTLRHNR